MFSYSLPSRALTVACRGGGGLVRKELGGKHFGSHLQKVCCWLPFCVSLRPCMLCRTPGLDPASEASGQSLGTVTEVAVQCR